MAKLVSAVIITKNEEKMLTFCLNGIKWVDEIIIVDCGSTDKTVKIAKKYGAKVYYKKWPGYAAQKNYAISKATGKWVLNIDADEVITEGLKYEIMTVLKNGTDKNAFDMPLNNIFYGRWLRHGGLSPDRNVRFFRKHCGKYPPCDIHEKLQIHGETGHFRNPLIRHAEEKISTHLASINEYTDLEVKHRLRCGCMPTGYTVFIRPVYRFIKYYFFKLGFLDGIQGLTFHLLTALDLFVQEVKILEKTGLKVNLLKTLFKRSK
jgi:glycosyltransferase involved in cell wall biosynthesis